MERGGAWPDRRHSPCAAYDTQQPRAKQLWPHSCVLVGCLFLLLPPFLCVAWSCAVVDKKKSTPLVRYNSSYILFLFDAILVPCYSCSMLFLFHVIYCSMLFLFYVILVPCYSCSMLFLFHVIDVPCYSCSLFFVQCYSCSMLFLLPRILYLPRQTGGVPFTWHGCFED